MDAFPWSNLIQDIPAMATMSSAHLASGRPTLLFPVLGHHTITALLQLPSSHLAMRTIFIPTHCKTRVEFKHLNDVNLNIFTYTTRGLKVPSVSGLTPLAGYQVCYPGWHLLPWCPTSGMQHVNFDHHVSWMLNSALKYVVQMRPHTCLVNWWTELIWD